MGNKLYFLFTLLLLSGLLSARAQDSSACNASFTAIPSGSQVYFRAMDSLPGVFHQWNFGDSTQTSTGNAMVIHTYSGSGTFIVTQTVTDSVTHCHSSSSQPVYIPGNSPTPTCYVSINVSGDSSTHLYTFVAIPSVPPGATDTITWTINGAPAGSGDSLRRHLSAKMYTVCATISTSLGCRVQSCVTINSPDTVPSMPPPPDSVRPSPPDSVMPSLPDTLLPSPPDSIPPSAPDSLLPAGSDSLAKGKFVPAYPNPATSQANLAVTLNNTATIYIRVYNSMGSEILSTSQSGYPGSNSIIIPVASLPTGIYYVQVQYGNTVLKSKIQKI
jgi:Secretion system C-terminal sorting domain/PKD domain